MQTTMFFYNHHYTATPEEAVRVVLRAGTDVDCTSFVPQFAASALQKGVINEDDLNVRLAYLFRMRMRLGHFDPVGPLDKIPSNIICSAYAQALARDGPVQSAALLKNEQSTLPLKADAQLSVAVIGPNSNLSKSMAGYYASNNVCNFNYWNLVDAVAQHAGKTTIAPGTPSVQSNDLSLIPAAVAAARAADIVVLGVGTDLSWAAEGHDATSIAFSEGQRQLIQQVAEAAKKTRYTCTI